MCYTISNNRGGALLVPIETSFDVNHHEFRAYEDLRFGDIIKIKAPFEENTKAYYNGHSPKLINPDGPITDRFNRTAKYRPVMVVSVDEGVVYYAPLTSIHNDRGDNVHHYQVTNNQLIPNSDRYKTYVETSTVRAFYTHPGWTLRYYTTLETRDRDNLRSTMSSRLADVHPIIDTYRYGSPKHIRHLERTLTEEGYTYKGENKHGIKWYESPNEKVQTSIPPSGLVFHHHVRTLEEVKAIHHKDQVPVKLDLTDLDQNIAMEQ